MQNARSLGIDIVYQDLALINQLTVYQNMFLNREPVRWPLLRKKQMRKEAQEHLDSMGIKTLKSVDLEVASLSGGQRQAIAVARSVFSDAKVLLLDEPLAAMGVKEGAMILDLERRQIPFIVALNCFDGARRTTPKTSGAPLDLEPDQPVVLCDARNRDSAKEVLITLVEHVLVTAFRGAAVRDRVARPTRLCRRRRWDSSPTRDSARRRSAGRVRSPRPSRAPGEPGSRCRDRRRPA